MIFHWHWWMLIIIVPLYLNFGWAFGVYFYKVTVRWPENAIHIFLQGGYKFFYAGSRESAEPSTLFKVTLMFSSPIILLVILTSWIIWLVNKILWLCFGGLAKLMRLS